MTLFILDEQVLLVLGDLTPLLRNLQPKNIKKY